eukprot:gnl/MRDRNA2_/MRDRNA2_126873_c0_seq1.p1 gnl/MRDRNA2_/MRDRNA2_126873_c0~~gnl/MRDRNA2_/MRDRNA2_126873_c0_seq1.p1  ORF type:complete len:211 (-),score=18.66 gnl/MRDRNA2_/MRDRNA2_126873_c0_seq1:223-855(-)
MAHRKTQSTMTSALLTVLLFGNKMTDCHAQLASLGSHTPKVGMVPHTTALGHAARSSRLHAILPLKSSPFKVPLLRNSASTRIYQPYPVKSLLNYQHGHHIPRRVRALSMLQDPAALTALREVASQQLAPVATGQNPILSISSLFGVGISEAAVIGVVLFFVFGTQGLTGIAKQAGATLRESKSAIQDAGKEFKETLNEDANATAASTPP